jgi:hypothetical protein
MQWSNIFEAFGKAVSVLAAAAGGWWAIEKWRKRDEHFPRVFFEVGVNFIGDRDGQIVAELVATLENKGVVPLKIRRFNFKLLGLKTPDALVRGGAEIRGQLRFPHVLEEGHFIPPDWDHTFVYPGVRTEYNFVTFFPADVDFVRMQGDFEYLRSGTSHHAAKVLKVPDPAGNVSAPPANTTPASETDRSAHGTQGGVP